MDSLILLPEEGPILDEIEQLEIPYRIINIGHSGWTNYHVPLLKMFLQEEKIDCVHANTLDSFPAILAAKHCHIPVVWHIHEMLSHLQHYHFGNTEDKEMAELAMYSSQICTVSEASKQALIEYFRQRNIHIENKVQVIYNGVGVSSAEPSYSLPSKFIIAGIGNMVELKGFDYLIKAYAELKKDYPGAELNIVGKVFPDYFMYLYGLAQKLEIGNSVRFLTETSEIGKIYLNSHIIVCSSVIENLPTVVLEAMAHGRPVVATDVGGVRELVKDQQTGLLVECKNAAALAKGMRYYLDNWAKATEIGRSAQQSVRENFSVEKQARQFCAIYKGLKEKGAGALTKKWTPDDIKQMLYEHIIAESEKIFRLEQYLESLIEQERRYREKGDNVIIDDLRTLEKVVENLLNKWPLRVMRKLSGLFPRKRNQ